MDMISVNSSAISAIGYNESTGHMKVRFKQGDTYDFCGVPLRIYQGFMSSYSKGSFYNTYIKDNYQCH